MLWDIRFSLTQATALTSHELPDRLPQPLTASVGGPTDGVGQAVGLLWAVLRSLPTGLWDRLQRLWDTMGKWISGKWDGFK